MPGVATNAPGALQSHFERRLLDILARPRTSFWDRKSHRTTFGERFRGSSPAFRGGWAIWQVATFLPLQART